ncbi:MAG TPA: hypothetical protein VGI39_23905 [Polyangiaceae bacterium]
MGLELPFATLAFAASTLVISSGVIGADAPAGYPLAILFSATAAGGLLGRAIHHLFARGSNGRARAGSLAASDEQQRVWVVAAGAIALSGAALAAVSPKDDVQYEALLAAVAILALAGLTTAAVRRVRTAVALASGLERIAQPHDPLPEVEVDLGLGDERWLKASKLEGPYRGEDRATQGVRGAVFDVQARLLRSALVCGGLTALCLSLLVLGLAGRARASSTLQAQAAIEVPSREASPLKEVAPPKEVTAPEKVPAPANPGPTRAPSVPTERPARARSLSFASGEDWPSFAGGAGADLGDARGASLGPATNVCVSPQFPSNCPAATPGALVYTNGGEGWRAAIALPQAHWIWRGDVALTAPGDLQVAVFERTFTVGAHPTGSIQVAADDVAAVFVNDTRVGAIGSVTDIGMAVQAQNVGARFDLTPALRPGPNKITIVAQNGPSSYAGGCYGHPCTYAQNPAGVVFAGALSWRDTAPASADR